MRAWREQSTNASAEYRQKLSAYETAKCAWEKRHADGIFPLCDLTPSPPSRVSYNTYGISLHVYDAGGSYNIFPWSRVGTYENIIWWVQHLCNKRWSDPRLIRDFVQLVEANLHGEIAKEVAR